MQSSFQPKKARLNVQLPVELKERLSRLSAFKRKKVSTLVRESIEEKLAQIDKQICEEKMKQAYQGLEHENIEISEDFKHVDAENL